MNRFTASVAGIFAIVLLIYCLFYFSDKILPASASPELNKTVIIDAGHGGEDGGTSSADGVLEKDINLKIALKLRSMLELAGYETVMIRDEDEQLGDLSLSTIRQRKISDIRSRLKITEDNPDAIFISIHQNYYTSPKYSGLQVFYSPKNAESRVLAECVQKSSVDLIQPYNTRSVKEIGSNIYLLYNVELPSVMVECGFLSNPQEASLLADDIYQSKIAFSVLCGIQKYMEAKDG